MKEMIGSKSEDAGLEESRLPAFTPEESARILGKVTISNLYKAIFLFQRQSES